MHLHRAIFVLLFASGLTIAAEPGIRTVSLRGLQVGATTTLTIDGDDLGSAPKLLLPFPAKTTLKPKNTEKQATFEIALGQDVPTGFAHLRIATEGGVSLPVIVAVDGLPQRPFAAEAGALPVAFVSNVSASNIIETTMKGQAGQKLQVEVEAQRLGSKLRPVIHLYGPTRQQIAWAWSSSATFGDCRLAATLPGEGVYTIAVHDVEYAAPTGSFFRLKLGEFNSVEGVYPPVVTAQTRSVEILGPSEPVTVKLPATGKESILHLTLPKGPIWSGARPWVEVSERVEFVEQPGNSKPQAIPAERSAVCGKLLAAFEEDRYLISAKPGTKLKFEAFAERLGSTADVALVIRNEAGAVLAKAEDGVGTLDPAFEYTVPAEEVGVILGVLDAQGRGGPRSVYRVTVDTIAKEVSDFSLTTIPQRLSLPAGGAALFPVLVERNGYTGPIEITADGLPKDATLVNTTIPAGADGTLVTITSQGSAADASITRWRGKAETGVVKPVLLKDHPLELLEPWLAGEISFARTAPPKDAFTLDWNKLPENATLTPGGKLSLPVKVTRPASNSVVRLTLVTSQLPRLVNNQPNPMQTLRAEAASGVELAAKATEGTLPLTVPPQLPGTMYDLAVKAELLSADKKTTLATAYTPVKRLPVATPKAKK